MTNVVRSLVFSFVVASVVGCSSQRNEPGAQADKQNELQEVAELIRGTTGPGGKGPSKLNDFDRHRSASPRGYQAVKSGEVVVLWGGGIQGEGEAAKGGGEIAAYEKDVPTNGGYVLLTSGEVKKMTAAEFEAAPKAGKK
jgi:hypothetical protein